MLLGRNWRTGLADPYHFILTLSWPRFFALAAFGFLLLNALFGVAYWIDPGSVANARPTQFLDYLFFSIETFATVGYGVMAPQNAYGHVVASCEIFVGMMGIALITGLVFARFSKPRARITFSRNLVMRRFDGQPALMVRLANQRANRIMEATASMHMVRNEITADGESFVRVHDLSLLRGNSPAFSLTWTLIHPIDAASPLHGWPLTRVEEAGTRIIVKVSGHDETMAATVHAIEQYAPDAIAVDHRFVDIITTAADGKRTVDLSRFHDVEPSRYI